MVLKRWADYYVLLLFNNDNNNYLSETYKRTYAYISYWIEHTHAHIALITIHTCSRKSIKWPEGYRNILHQRKVNIYCLEISFFFAFLIFFIGDRLFRMSWYLNTWCVQRRNPELVVLPVCPVCNLIGCRSSELF